MLTRAMQTHLKEETLTKNVSESPVHYGHETAKYNTKKYISVCTTNEVVDNVTCDNERDDVSQVKQSETICAESTRQKSNTETIKPCPFERPESKGKTKEPFLPEFILDCIKDYGRNSVEVHERLGMLCANAKRLFKNEPSAHVWVGYESGEKNVPVLVAMVKEIDNTVPKTFCSFKMEQRVRGDVSPEAKEIANYETEKNLKFSRDELKELRKCITKYSPQLMEKHSKLNLVSASKIKSSNYCKSIRPDTNENKVLEETTCIVLIVQFKGIIPFNEDEFAHTVGTFPVDVREGVVCNYANTNQPNDYLEKLKMGCQIGNEYGRSATLGGFVQLQNGSIGCLTNWHMFQSFDCKNDLDKDLLIHRHFKKDVHQPSSLNSTFKFGQVIDAQYDPGDKSTIGVDAALIEITDSHRNPVDGCFPAPNTSDARSSPFEFHSGNILTSIEEVELNSECKVMKYGAQTRVTLGEIHLGGVAARRSTDNEETNKCPLYQLIEIRPTSEHGEPFAVNGDSGSLVFIVSEVNDDEELLAFGMLWGGYGSSDLVIPIWAILKSFNLPLRLLSFEEASRLRKLEGKIEHKIQTTKQELGNQIAELKSTITTKFDLIMNALKTGSPR